MSLRSCASALLAIALFTAPSAVRVRAQAIEGLGFTHPMAMSYDGSVVVGLAYSASSGEYVVYRWEVGEGAMLIEGAIGTDSESVSGDGRVLLGSTNTGDDDQHGTAFKWTDGEMTLLPALNFAGRANHDGSVIAGGKRNEDTKDWEAVVDGGANYGEGMVNGIDSAGINMVGYVVIDKIPRARIWPAGTDLGEGYASAISPDGNTVIGSRPDGTSFRWTRSGSLDLLIPGYVSDMTRDGATIVGSAAGAPFIWTETDGTQPLSVFLSERGVVLEGWQLHGARLISEDGNVLVGNGTNPQGEPEGWRVELCGSIVAWSASSGGAFGDADNWSSGTVPGTPNIASFVEPGSYSVSLNDDVEIDQLQVWEDVDLTLSTGASTYNVPGDCSGRSVYVQGGFLELQDGALQAEEVVQLYGAEPVLSVGATARLVVDSDEDGVGCLVADGEEGTEALVSVAGGGEIESHACTFLGDIQGSRGRMVIDGDGSLHTDTLVIGTLGDGVLELPGTDGRVRVDQLWMAVAEGSSAHGEVADLSSIVFRDTAYVGMRGEATLEMTDVGIFAGGPTPEGLSLLVLGRDESGNGRLHMKDHSFFQNSDAIIGMDGDGTMILESGASAVIRRIWIGGHLEGTTGQGTVGVSGEGSKLDARLIWIGRGKVGMLVAAGGGRVTAGQITLYGNGVSFEDGGGRIVAPILQVGGVPTAQKRQTEAQDEEGVFADTLLVMGDGQQLEVEQFVMAPGGVLGGTGPFSFPIVNVGTIAPADTAGAAGTFRTTASYTQTAAGRLELDVTGTAEGQYDRLEVEGPATLAGALRLRIDDEAFSPQVGDRFEIVRATGIEGTFDEVNAWPYRVALTYSATAITAEVTSLVSTEEEAELEDLPSEYALEQNYPNPFNPSTEIVFSLPKSGPARLVLYDLLGQEVAVLVDGAVAAGTHRIRFDARGLPSGVYLYRLDAGAFSRARRMVVMR